MQELAKIDGEMRRLYQRQQQIKSDYAAAMADEVFGITRGAAVQGYDTMGEFKSFVVDKAYFFDVSISHMELWVMSEGGARLPAKSARVVPPQAEQSGEVQL